MTLWPSDGIKLSDNTKDWERLGLAKIKDMVANADIYVPDPIVEVPASSAVEAQVSSAPEVPASSASTQETTTPSESTTEA